VRNIAFLCDMVEDTKQAIIDAAIIIFNEDLSAPLEKVADEAKVTRRTLHRYFKDRQDLLVSCNQEMQKGCSKAITVALQSSDKPTVQLENMLYAAIDCGVKYAFLHKLHTMHGHQHLSGDKECARYDQTVNKLRGVVISLKENNTLSQYITVDWVIVLFPGIVTATINSLNTSLIDNQKLKELAWFSFSKGIGI
jgi:AcrR family transcriptional regulator